MCWILARDARDPLQFWANTTLAPRAAWDVSPLLAKSCQSRHLTCSLGSRTFMADTSRKMSTNSEEGTTHDDSRRQHFVAQWCAYSWHNSNHDSTDDAWSALTCSLFLRCCQFRGHVSIRQVSFAISESFGSGGCQLQKRTRSKSTDLMAQRGE